MNGIIKKIGAFLISAVMALGAFSAAFAADEQDYSEYYAAMRKRWEDTLTGGAGLDVTDEKAAEKIKTITDEAQALIDKMEPQENWESNGYIWQDLDTAKLSNFEKYSAVYTSYGRLKQLALAYRAEGTLKGNEDLKNTVLAAMSYLNEYWFNKDTEQTGNWWYWQIGMPLNINDVLILMYDEVNSDLLTSYMEAIDAHPPLKGHVLVGANQVWYSTVRAVRGALGETPEKLNDAKSGIESVLPYVKSGDGFYEDGSFVQHNMYAYTGGYGSSLMKNLAPVIAMLYNTPWQITEGINNVFAWVYDSFEPLFYKGAFMDMVRGREISRKTNSGFVTGRYILEAILQLAEFAGEQDAAYFKSLVKYMISESSGVYDFLGETTLYCYTLAQKILNDGTIPVRDEYQLYKVYADMDRAVQHRAGYSVGISMHSERIAAFEKINGENIKGWYTGSGMLYLYNNDLTQYAGNFWATVDTRRLAGTTVLRGVSDLPAESGSVNALGRNSFAGGVSLGKYGVAGMQLMPVGQTLNAKKSYFMFDNEIVCLGTDINAADGDDIETTVENRKLSASGDNALTVDGAAAAASIGASETVTAAWAHLAGNDSESDGIGYFFPKKETLNIVRESRTNNWSSMNQAAGQKDDTDYTDNYLTMYINHGVTPSNADYEYVLLPNMSSDGVKSYAENADVEILANNTNVQAAYDKSTQVTGANFWSNTETAVQRNGEDWIVCNGTASVAVSEADGKLEIAVSDPTQKNTGSVGIEVGKEVAKLISKDDRVKVVSAGSKVRLLIDMSGSNGQTVTASFEIGESLEAETAPEITEAEYYAFGKEDTDTAVKFNGIGTMEFGIENAPSGITVDRFGILHINAGINAGIYKPTLTVKNTAGESKREITVSKYNGELTTQWDFDSVSNGKITDSLGTQRTITLYGNAKVEDGSVYVPNTSQSINSKVHIANKASSDLAFTKTIEIDLKVKFTESPTDREQVIIKKYPISSGYVEYGLRVNKEGKIGLCWNNNWYSGNALEWSADTWYRLRVCYNGHTITFMRDGESCGAVQNTESATQVGTPLIIGTNAAGNYFSGYIDDVILVTPYDTVPTAEPSKSVVYWNFNEGGGTSVASKSSLSIPSGGDYNATISQSVKWVEGFVGTGLKFDSLSDTLKLNKSAYISATRIGMSPYEGTANDLATGAEYDFWVNFSVSPFEHEQYIFHRNHSTASVPYAVKVDDSGKLCFAWNSSWVQSDSLEWNTGEWYHINIVHMNDSTVTLKRDGLIVGTGKVNKGIIGTTDVVVINQGNKVNADNCFKGIIDEFYMGALGGGKEITMRSKVSFNTGCDTVTAPTYYWVGETAQKPADPTRSGYKFLGWYTDSKYTESYDFSAKITDDITLYAKWAKEGDVNADGTVDICDLVKLNMLISNGVTAENEPVCDYNNDGYVDEKDLLLLKKKLLGIS